MKFHTNKTTLPVGVSQRRSSVVIPLCLLCTLSGVTGVGVRVSCAQALPMAQPAQTENSAASGSEPGQGILSGDSLGLTYSRKPLETSDQPSWTITPGVTTGLTATDNINPGYAGKKGGLITSIAPTIKVAGRGGRVSGMLDFSWQKNIYGNESRYNNDQKQLTASGKAELVDQWLFLDANAHIAQTPISIFSAQNVGNELASNNRSETRSLELSPYIQGSFGSTAGYELRQWTTRTTSDAGLYTMGSGLGSQAWSGKVFGMTPFSSLGWSLLAEDQRYKYDSRTTKTNRFLGLLEYRIDPQLRLNAGAGTESDNYNNLNLRRRSVGTFGFDWAPTERTLLKANGETRSYGNGHQLDFSHRTAMTTWKFTDSKSVILPAQQFSSAPMSTAYDLLFLQLTSDPLLRGDPQLRAQVARQLLQQAGIPADSQTYGNLMATQPFMQRNRQASVFLTGGNNTVTLSAQRSDNSKIGTGVSTIDDFALSQNIKQTGISASWSHRLTPDSSVTLNAVSSHNKGDTAAYDSQLRSVSLLYSTKLGARTTATFGLRQNNFDGSGTFVADYTEHAISGTLSASF